MHPEKKEMELYYDGLLEEEKRKAVENHLKNCEECSEYLEFIALTGKILKEKYRVNNSCERAVKNIIDEIKAPLKHDRKKFYSFNKIFALSISAAASIAVFILYFFIFGNRGLSERVCQVDYVYSDNASMVINMDNDEKIVWIMDENEGVNEL